MGAFSMGKGQITATIHNKLPGSGSTPFLPPAKVAQCRICFQQSFGPLPGQPGLILAFPCPLLGLP